ncbi:MAG: cell division protein ZapA [Bacteroidales bacterium]|nr:cell division protein ZapA [Bacteroidales bacterium]
MKELNINITIADRPYRLTIDRAEEEVVRKAADKVNEKVKAFARNYSFKDKQDLLAMIALQYTTEALQLNDQQKFVEMELDQRLSSLDDLLSEYQEV